MKRLSRSIAEKLPTVRLVPFQALRAALKEGYGLREVRSDLMSGVVVGIIALPLSMALAIAVGVPPQYGLYTAVVAGFLVALLGGSRFQVSGPTAAFVVILAPVTAKFGLAGLALATVMAGLIQMMMGLAGLGRLIQFIPYPVVTGFTAGIAVVIATLQLTDFLGLSVAESPESYVERLALLWDAMPSLRPAEFGIGLLALGLLIVWPRLDRRIPAPLVALTVASLAAWVMQSWGDDWAVATIRDRFGSDASPHGIPQQLPAPGRPWLLAPPGGEPLSLSLGLIRELLPAAFAIAMLGAIESLLSAVVADGMTGKQHDPDSELMAQGTGNVVAPFFGGFAATGAIARTAANIRFGARSPISAMVHAVFILLTVLLMAPLLGYLPMAALAALLLRVAWTMSEARHFVRTCRIAPRGDVLVLLTCFGLTIFFDMVIAVGMGVVLAAILFMRRMAEVADVRLIGQAHEAGPVSLPPGVLVYEIAGPLFFGAAHRAMSRLRELQSNIRVVIMDMRDVPVIDVTGLVNLESAIERLTGRQVLVILAGVQKQPLAAMAKARIRKDRHLLVVCRTMEHAIEVAAAVDHLSDQAGDAT